jgi:hypothetical protein
VFSVVASILVLPSMLALWDGWDRRRSGRASGAGELTADRVPAGR